MGDEVKGEIMEGVGLVTFDLPTHNVATAQTWNALTAKLSELAADPALRVLVLTGAGHHAFITDPAAAAIDAQATHDAAAAEAVAALAALRVPSIARVRGDCIGAGLVLTLHADLVIAGEDSAFSLPGARWGAAYAPASVARLVSLVGPQQARRLLYAGGRVEARDALAMGLVTMVVPDVDLSEVVVDLARAIADNAPLAVTAARRMVAEPGAPDLGGLVEACRNSADYAAALDALRAEKTPVFQGR